MKIIHHEVGRDPLYKIWHASSSCMIIYFYTDGGSIVLQNQIYPIEKGGLCFIRARQQHYTLPDQPEKYDRSKIYLSESVLGAILELAGEDQKLHDLFRDSSAVYAQIPEEQRAAVERIYDRAEQCLAAEADTTTFLWCLFSLMIYLRDFSSDHITNPKGHLTRAIAYINHHYAEHITLDDIVREAYISKYYLCRSFKTVVGMTVMEYLLKTRIAVAKNHLRAGALSIGEIAERCGFLSVSYFSQIFKKTTGLTPLQYRRQCERG